MRDTDKKRENQNVRDTDKREGDRKGGRECDSIFSDCWKGKEREGKGIGWERWSTSTEDCQQSAQTRNKFL